MALHEDEVAAVGLVRRVPEVVEADVVERRGGGEARDVAAELAREAVRLHHHRQGVPPDERADAPFDGGIAGGVLGARFGDGVDVGGVDRERQGGAALARVIHQRGEKEVGALDAVAIDDGVERVDPVPGLDGVDVGHLRIGGHGVLSESWGGDERAGGLERTGAASRPRTVAGRRGVVESPGRSISEVPPCQPGAGYCVRSLRKPWPGGRESRARERRTHQIIWNILPNFNDNGLLNSCRRA